MAERTKKETDGRHPMYGQIPPSKRLCSRISFLNISESLSVRPLDYGIRLWQGKFPSVEFSEKENLPTGHDLPYVLWRTLNRLRVGVARTNSNLARWDIQENQLCES